MEQVIDQAPAVLTHVWLRLLSPSSMRLLAPALAVAILVAGSRTGTSLGRSVLGQATRLWCLLVPAAAFLAGTLYALVLQPEEPDLMSSARLAPFEKFGRTLLAPAPAALGSVILAAVAALCAWRWWLGRLSADERRRLADQWQESRRRWQPRLLAWAAAPLSLGVAACAIATAVPPAIPPLPGITSGSMWVGTSAGVSRLVPGPGMVRWQAIAWPWVPLPSNRVRSIAAGPGGEVWIGTAAGLLRFADGASRPDWQRIGMSRSDLPNAGVLALAVDGDGAAWVGTEEGGATIDESGRGRAFTAANTPLLHQILDAVCVDRGGRVWFGGAGGVNVFQPPAARRGSGDWPAGFTRYSSGGALPDDLVFAIYEDRRGRMWFGTRGGAAVIAPDPNGFALGAFDLARWQTFTTINAPLPHDKVHAIVEDRQGRIWLGTEKGIAILDESRPAADQWQRLLTAPDIPGSPSGAWITALAVSPDGRIWAGTKQGLAVLNPADPAQGWQTYRSHPLRRWTGLFWPPHRSQDIVSNDVTALAWVP
jgi:hypothetical protein